MQSLRCVFRLKLVSTRPVSTHVSQIRYMMKLKEDDEACREALKSADMLLYHRLAPLLQKRKTGVLQPPRLTTPDVEVVLEKLRGDKQLISEAVLIGCSQNNQPQFCLDVGDLEQRDVEQICGGVFVNLRKALFMLNPPDVPLVAKGQALLRWHQTHGFCSATGQPTVRNQSGSQRVCSASNITYYPQMAPVVIVLVSDGSRCLLGRQSSFPPGLYSALAGFCDLGETLEEALQREVMEEVGLEVEEVQYSASQHWPFPHTSLMLAYHATVHPDNTQVSVDEAELEDARWFSLEEILAALQIKKPPHHPPAEPPDFWLPPAQAIANQLIREWAHQQQLSRK